MIQDKNFLMRRLQQLASMLNDLITSYPFVGPGQGPEDIDQQVYTATGLTTEDFLKMDEPALEAVVQKYGQQGTTLVLDLLGNLFYHQYLVTGDKQLLKKAQDFYTRFQAESGTFSMVYFQRIQQS